MLQKAKAKEQNRQLIAATTATPQHWLIISFAWLEAFNAARPSVGHVSRGALAERVALLWPTWKALNANYGWRSFPFAKRKINGDLCFWRCDVMQCFHSTLGNGNAGMPTGLRVMCVLFCFVLCKSVCACEIPGKKILRPGPNEIRPLITRSISPLFSFEHVYCSCWPFNAFLWLPIPKNGRSR